LKCLTIGPGIIRLRRMSPEAREATASRISIEPPGQLPRNFSLDNTTDSPDKPSGLRWGRSIVAPLLFLLLILAVIAGSWPPDQAGPVISPAHAFEVFQKPISFKPALDQDNPKLILAMAYQVPKPRFRYRSSRKLMAKPGALRAKEGPGKLPSVETRQRFYWPTVKDMAKLYKVDPALVMAVIQVESTFNPDAVSNRQAMGLMQIVPNTADHLGLATPFDPEANIEAGVRYLAWLNKMFKRNERKVLAAYNAGPTLVKKKPRVLKWRNTRRYIAKVQKYRNMFKRRLHKFDAP
jgi:soluble lytic murein transglycosylase-like protein